jgi:drug/metabolite transporter (DMT)-like permease
MKLFLLCITIFSWGIWGVLNKLVLQRLHPLQMFIVGCCMSFVLLPIYALLLKNTHVPSSNYSFSVGSVLLCCAASLASSAGSVAYVYGIRTGDLGTVAVLSSAYPVLTVALSVMFFGEVLTVPKIIGIILVMSGVVVLAR